MTWFIDWWNGFSTVQQILLALAIPSTLILVLQAVLLIIGLGDHGSDVDNGEADLDGIDTDGDGVPDAIDIDGDGVPDALDLDGDGVPDVMLDGAHFEAGDANDVNAVRFEGAHHSSGLKLLSLRGIVAFFAVGSWLGIALIDLGVSIPLSCALAFAGGFLALLLCALIIKWSLSMQENGTFSAKNAIAHTATV